MEKKLTSPILLIEGGAGDANLRYGAGFTAPDPQLFLLHGRKRYLVVSVLEAGRARRTLRNVTVFTPGDLDLDPSSRYDMAQWAVALLCRLGVKRVRVPRDFPFATAQSLMDAGFRVDAMDGPVFPERRIKSAREARCITEVQRATVQAMRAAMRMIRDAKVDRRGHLMHARRRLRAEDVRHVIERELLAAECLAGDTIVAGGRQGADPHERGSGPLRAGEPIVIDIFPRHRVTGYHGDLTRTVIKGQASEAVRRMYRAVYTAQHQALNRVRAGIEVRTIHAAVQQVFTDAGFKTEVRNGVPVGFFHSTGHGIGLDVHEAPSINLSRTRLRAGDVVTIEPGLYYPQWGGVRIEDTVRVTRTGCRMLAPCEKYLEL